jgi:hypothetical protein
LLKPCCVEIGEHFEKSNKNGGHSFSFGFPSQAKAEQAGLGAVAGSYLGGNKRIVRDGGNQILQRVMSCRNICAAHLLGRAAGATKTLHDMRADL